MSRVRASGLALSRETCRREGQRERHRGEEEQKGKNGRREQETETESERQDEPRPKRILEVKIERVSGELLLLSDSSTVVCVTGVFVPGRLK